MDSVRLKHPSPAHQRPKAYRVGSNADPDHWLPLGAAADRVPRVSQQFRSICRPVPLQATARAGSRHLFPFPCGSAVLPFSIRDKRKATTARDAAKHIPQYLFPFTALKGDRHAGEQPTAAQVRQAPDYALARLTAKTKRRDQRPHRRERNALFTIALCEIPPAMSRRLVPPFLRGWEQEPWRGGSKARNHGVDGMYRKGTTEG